MPKFVKLTGAHNGYEQWFDLEKLVTFIAYQEGTCLDFGQEDQYDVKETPEQILALIEGEGL